MDPTIAATRGVLPEWVLAALIAPFAGSFLGVLARRLPAHRPIVLARSACDGCGAALGPAELVPLVSYVVLRGRCRQCGAPIGRFHPAMELAALAVALCAACVFDGALLWASCCLGWGLLVLSVCDWEHTILPDALTLPLLLLGLAVTWWVWPPDLSDHALAAALGYGAFRGVAWVYRRLRGWDGLGGGDAKLLAASGAWLGVAALPWVVLAAALAGLGLAALIALRRGLSARTQIPFGPCLALATWVIWLTG